MRVAFDKSCIVPVEALLVVDPMSVPEAIGQDSINVALEFYVNSKEDIYEGCTKISTTFRMYKGISSVGI